MAKELGIDLGALLFKFCIPWKMFKRSFHIASCASLVRLILACHLKMSRCAMTYNCMCLQVFPLGQDAIRSNGIC